MNEIERKVDHSNILEKLVLAMEKTFKELKSKEKREILKIKLRVDIFDSPDDKMEIIKHENRHAEIVLSVKLLASVISLFTILGTIITLVIPYL